MIRYFASLVTLSLLVGCCGPQAAPSPSRPEQARSSEQARVVPASEPLRAEPGPIVSIEARGTPLRDVLESLGRQTGRNFVAEPAAQALPITLVLTDVSWPIALDLICERYGLEVEQVGGGTYVTDPPKVTISSGW